MNRIPIKPLATTHLQLQPFSDEHVSAAYVAWLNDPEVVEFSEQRHREHSLESCRAYLAEVRSSSTLFWAVIESETRRHIGNITAHFDENNGIADVGILLGEKQTWGKGYGYEAFDVVCHYLLTQESIRKVTAGTLETNTGMRKIMDKLGMSDDGYRPRHYVVNGKEVGLVYGALYPTASGSETI